MAEEMTNESNNEENGENENNEITVMVINNQQ